jgi:hypothetical protein
MSDQDSLDRELQEADPRGFQEADPRGFREAVLTQMLHDALKRIDELEAELREYQIES